jgi:hypothetical protein
MSLILSGTDGLSDVDGSAATPAIRGTDANTGIFFPAADTIAFSEGGVEAVRINSAGAVLVNTTSATGSTRMVVADATGNGQIRAIHSTGLGLNINQASASGAAFIQQQDNADLGFSTNNSERMRIDSSGRVLVGLTSANTSGANFQVSQGVTFPATQSASSDANTLDDYEEGTWTPSTVIGNNLTSISVSDGRYTKIGKLVTVSASVTGSITSSGTETNINLSSLPFNAYSSSWYAGGTWFGYAGTGQNRFATGLAFNGAGSATTVVFYIAGVNVNTTGSLTSMVSFTYIASA